MATVTLRNLGGSVVMVVPKKILSLVDLKAGSQVRIGVENGRVVIEPRAKPHYTPADLRIGGHGSPEEDPQPGGPQSRVASADWSGEWPCGYRAAGEATLHAGGIACEVPPERAQALPQGS